MSNDVALELLKKLGKGFNNHDVNAILECVTDDFGRNWKQITGTNAG